MKIEREREGEREREREKEKELNPVQAVGYLAEPVVHVLHPPSSTISWLINAYTNAHTYISAVVRMEC